MSRLLIIATILAYSVTEIGAFVIPSSTRRQSTLQFAKRPKASAGQGFGQQAPPRKQSSSQSDSAPLESVETGASDAIPTMEQKVQIDSSLPPEERAKQVLREQYGLKTLEEQQSDERKREKMAAARAQREQWNKMAEKEELDIIALIPGPVQIFIDRFLKLGVAICTVLFVSAGIAITAEAWSKASGNALSPDVDAFIVNVVEPNFTPGLFVLLGFSVSLGAFSAAQLGSAGAQYKEDR
jgi:hypothetical protein